MFHAPEIYVSDYLQKLLFLLAFASIICKSLLTKNISQAENRTTYHNYLATYNT